VYTLTSQAKIYLSWIPWAKMGRECAVAGSRLFLVQTPIQAYHTYANKTHDPI